MRKMPAFDFHTLSLTIDNTLAEYQEATGTSAGRSIMGLLLPEILAGDRSKFLSFRHEHAHFASFVATGLADLYGIFSDYLGVMCYVSLRAVVQNSRGHVRVPLYNRGDLHSAPTVAYAQVNHLRACLFGFGSRITRGDVLAVGPQDTFWRSHYDERFQRIVHRYYALSEMLARGPEFMTAAEAAIRMTPLVSVRAGTRALSARAVMEAYAIAIELVATHIRKVETNLTIYERSPTRQPGPMYTVALEYALEQLPWGKAVGLDEFLNGNAPLACYHLVPVVTFAAMVVPVLQTHEGHVRVAGDLRALSVAHAFTTIIAGLRDGVLPWPATDFRSAPERDARLTDWLAVCREFLGDVTSMTLYAEAKEAFQRVDRLKTLTAASQTVTDVIWAARANLAEEPSEYVLDAGLFAERHPCQPRFVRTSDNRVVILEEVGSAREARYISEHAVPILEAAVFGEQWDSTWAKLPEIDRAGRADLVQAALLATAFTFSDVDAIGDDPLTVEIAEPR